MEKYNELVKDLVDSLEESKVISKDSKIICCTNGHSPISYELGDRGYDAKEELVKRFSGNCDVLITKVSDSDIIKLMDSTDEKTKLLVMYNRLFTGLTAQKMEKYSEGNIGSSVGIQEGDRTEPFDNRVFCYDFTKGDSE